jgi:hypothetical protein
MNIPDKKEKLEFAKHLIGIAEPVAFSAEIASWFRSKNEDKYPNGFSKEEILEFMKFLVERIKGACFTTNIFTEFPEDVGRLLSIWAFWDQGQDRAEYLAALFKENPVQASTLIDSLVSTAWAMDTGISSKGDLERENYNNISKIMPPEKVMEALEKVFGDELNVEEYPYGYPGENTNLRLAQQFSWIHRKVEKEGKHDNQNEEQK